MIDALLLIESTLHYVNNNFKTTPRQYNPIEISSSQCLHMALNKLPIMIDLMLYRCFLCITNGHLLFVMGALIP